MPARPAASLRAQTATVDPDGYGGRRGGGLGRAAMPEWPAAYRRLDGGPEEDPDGRGPPQSTSSLSLVQPICCIRRTAGPPPAPGPAFPHRRRGSAVGRPGWSRIRPMARLSRYGPSPSRRGPRAKGGRPPATSLSGRDLSRGRLVGGSPTDRKRLVVFLSEDHSPQ